MFRSGWRAAADAARSSACSSSVTAGCRWAATLKNELRDTVARVKERAVAARRDPEAITFRYTIGIGRSTPRSRASASRSPSVDPAALGADGSPEAVAGEIARFETAGFNELAINFSGESASEVMEQLEWFGEAVMPIL